MGMRRFRPGRSSLRVATAMVLVGIAAACGGSLEPAGDSGGDVRPGGTVVYASVQKLAGFNQQNPRSARLLLSNVMRNVWPSTFKDDARDQHVVNHDLVESAEITTNEPQTVVYKLNPRAVWSDGDPIDAQEFLYLWRTAYTPGAKDVDGSDIVTTAAHARGAIRSVIASDDDKTVTVTFGRPYPEWRSLFRFLPPAHIAERVGWNHGFDTFDPAVVVSGGPFRIASHDSDNDLTLVRNERYWGSPATLDSIVIRFVPDGNQLLAAIKNAELDLALIVNPSADTLSQARAVPGLTSVVHEQTRYTRLYFNFRNPILAVPDVRRAISLAVDRTAVLARSTAQLDPAAAKLADSYLFPPGEAGSGGAAKGRYQRADVGQATRLLGHAGFARGSDGVFARGEDRMSFRLPSGGGIAELIQAQLRAAGIEIRIGAPIDALATGDFDLVLNSRPTAPEEVAAQFSTAGGFNYGRYSNPAVDELIAQADSELDDARRQALYVRIDELLWEDLPTLPLEWVLGVIVHRNTLANVTPHAAGAIFWNADKWGVRVDGGSPRPAR